ncbi:MAG: hypothetical protein JWQ62_195, partial [Lacunisphaera sp.]|nr:hypothetical protein [Lacunisphaera sp.]
MPGKRISGITLPHTMPLNQALFVLLRRVLPLALFVLLGSALNAAEAAKINFNLPAG